MIAVSLPEVMRGAVLGLLHTAVVAYEIVIFLAVLFSWFRPSPWGSWGGLVRFVQSLTEPLFLWLRRSLPLSVGGIDFSPMLVLFVLDFLRRILSEYLSAGGGP